MSRNSLINSVLGIGNSKMVVTRTPVRVLKLSTFVYLVLNKFLFKLNNKDSKVIVYANDVEMFLIKGEFFFAVILKMKYKVHLFRVNHLYDISLVRLIQNNVQISYFSQYLVQKNLLLNQHEDFIEYFSS